MKKSILVLIVCLAITVLGIALIGCSEDEGTSSITNLTYNGEDITWSSVKNAKNYKIKINGSESIVSQAKGTVSHKYNSNGEDFDFSIEAVIKEGSDKNPKYSLRFENIGQVDGLDIVSGNLVWNSLETAERYEIMYNGDIVGTVGTNEYETQAGKFTYKVRALKGQAESTNGNIPYFSIWSDVLSGTVLAAPDNLKYDSERFNWEKVTEASSYLIKIGNDEFEANTNSYSYAAGTEDFSVNVKAIGNKAQNIYDSQYSETKKYTYIAPIEGLNVVDGTLKWTASENAVAYKIKVNGIVNNDELKVNEYSALQSGASYRIQVLPLGKSDFYFSHWSNEITVNILRSPVVGYSDSVIRWNEVAGCEGYEIKIEKDNQTVFTTSVGKETFVYNYAFEDVGDYQVYVKATSLGTGGVYESKYSQPYSVKRLATPTNKQVVNRPLEQNQVSVTFTPVVGAVSYQLLADDVEIATTVKESAFSVDISKMTDKSEESAVNFKIVARGAVTTSGAVLDSKVPLEFNVTKLATPQNLRISGSSLEWDSVNHTSKYVLTIDGKRTEITTTGYTITDMAAGNHTIYVQAMGNGEDVITGGFSNALDVRKLQKPSALNISTSGLLTWDAVDGATEYKVILGTGEYNPDGRSFNVLGYEQFIQEGVGTQISVYAVGNGSNILNSDVSDTKTLSKYNRPSTVKVNGDQLVWNPSSVNSINCNSYEVKISQTGVEDRKVVVSGTSYAMSNFNAGDYTVTVTALGDKMQTFNSPESNQFVFTKLAAISGLTKSDNQYSWANVVGAQSYEIKTSRNANWTTVNTNSFVPNFTTAGEFEVSIRAVGNGIDVISSDIYSFTQKVNKITMPVVDDTLGNTNAFSVKMSGYVLDVSIRKYTGAIGYKVYVDGIDRMASFNTNSSASDAVVTYSLTQTTVGATYTVQVQILGGYFDNEGNYVLDSDKSAETSVTYTA